MDVSVAPEHSPNLPLSDVRPPRLWACPGYVSFPAMLVLLAVLIAGMQFIAGPMAARYAARPAVMAGGRR